MPLAIHIMFQENENDVLINYENIVIFQMMYALPALHQLCNLTYISVF